MKWRRVIEYEGDPEWVERTLKKSIHGVLVTRPFDGTNEFANTITELSSQEITDDAPSTDEAVPHVQPDLGGEVG